MQIDPGRSGLHISCLGFHLSPRFVQLNTGCTFLLETCNSCRVAHFSEIRAICSGFHISSRNMQPGLTFILLSKYVQIDWVDPGCTFHVSGSTFLRDLCNSTRVAHFFYKHATRVGLHISPRYVQLAPGCTFFLETCNPG